MWKFKVNKIFILYHNITGGAEGLVCSRIYACRKRYGEVKLEMEFDKESH